MRYDLCYLSIETVFSVKFLIIIELEGGGGTCNLCHLSGISVSTHKHPLQIWLNSKHIKTVSLLEVMVKSLHARSGVSNVCIYVLHPQEVFRLCS